MQPFLNTWLTSLTTIFYLYYYTAPGMASAGPIRGFQKDVLKAGDPSKRPTPGKTVTIHCTGYGKDGDLRQKFLSTHDEGQTPFTFSIGVGEVIRVWDEGVMSMAVGELARITCGSEYGYGAVGFPLWGIKPFSALQFEIELLDVWVPPRNGVISSSGSNGGAGGFDRKVGGALNGNAGGGGSAPLFGGARNRNTSAGVTVGSGGSNFDNNTSSSAIVFSVTHRVPGPIGLQMMPITISYVSDITSGMMPSVVIACLITVRGEYYLTLG